MLPAFWGAQGIEKKMCCFFLSLRTLETKIISPLHGKGNWGSQNHMPAKLDPLDSVVCLQFCAELMSFPFSKKCDGTNWNGVEPQKPSGNCKECSQVEHVECQTIGNGTGETQPPAEDPSLQTYKKAWLLGRLLKPWHVRTQAQHCLLC